ncbi:MAG: thymidylate synthase [Pseudomonadota bacterium]
MHILINLIKKIGLSSKPMLKMFMEVVADSLDDILREVFTNLIATKRTISPSKGKAREEIGVHIVLNNPRARFSRTESRATLFSCMGELLWYLTGDNSLEFIRHYIPKYSDYSDDGMTLHGAYGPRIFGDLFDNHWLSVSRILRDKPDSRQAVIPIYQPSDVTAQTKDLPCTCTLQFFKRDNLLHMQVHMRSNDAYLGLPHDIFAFTMMQELMAAELTCGVGKYHHSVGSLHLYDTDREKVATFLNEGWQSTTPMPAMPNGDQSTAIAWLMQVDACIRSNETYRIDWSVVQPYWQDLGRIILIQDLIYRKKMRSVAEQRRLMSTSVYESFIRRKEEAAIGIGVQGRLAL